MATAPTQNLSFPQPTLPDRLDDSEEYRQVLAMTQRLFPGPIGVRRKEDPEFPEEYVVFNVRAKGTFEEGRARDREWHQECLNLAGSASFLYRLAVWYEDVSE
jgi:hypothetical protein